MSINWNSREDVIKEVAKNGLALKYASDKLKDDVGVVERAITEDGCAVQFSSERLRANRNIAIIAVAHDYSAIKYIYISDELKEDAYIYQLSKLNHNI